MGGLYEQTGSAIRKYYAIAGMTFAVDDGNGMKYLVTDHLGSVAAITDADGTLLSQQRYLPFGEVRDLCPLPPQTCDPESPVTQTDFGYTGQREVESLGLMDYKARFYDAALGRFTQPDTIIPSLPDPQSWNRYSYVVNDPIALSDPTGQRVACGVKGDRCENEPLYRIKGHDRSREEDGGPMGPEVPEALTSATGTSGTGQQLKGLGNWAKYGNLAIKALVWLGDYGLPAYKQWGRGVATLTPFVEGAAGTILQAAQDFDNPSLTPGQKVVRALMTGLEGGLSEAVSEPWAVAGGELGAELGASAGAMTGSPLAAALGGAGGGLAGYEAGSFGATWLMDRLVWDPVNEASGFFP